MSDSIHEIGLTNLRAEWKMHEAEARMVLRIGPFDSNHGYYLKPEDAAELAAFIVRTVGRVALLSASV